MGLGARGEVERGSGNSSVPDAYLMIKRRILGRNKGNAQNKGCKHGGRFLVRKGENKQRSVLKVRVRIVINTTINQRTIKWEVK